MTAGAGSSGGRPDSGADGQRERARRLLAALTPTQQGQARRVFGDGGRRQWSYLPGIRDGLPLHEMSREQQQVALRLVAGALRRHAFAQVAAILALEDVLDLDEGGSGRRHRGDYWVAIYGEPGEDPWGWRFEGHHVSINVSVADGAVRSAPLFLGANPAAVGHAGAAVLRPLGQEEDLARALLDALDPAARRVAVRDHEAPGDIRTGRAQQVEPTTAEGVVAGELPETTRALLHRLVEVYLQRLPPELAGPHLDALAGGGWDAVCFAWRGSTQPGGPHYYRLGGPRLLVEYDNTQNDANHVHTVLRDPHGDFGADLLAAHYAAAH